jgi:hypothetical protein
MNEDKQASRNGVSEPPPSPLEKVGTHPLGAAAGVIGDALTGALVGVAEEDRYWREHYAKRPYVPAGADYADWGRRPAYRHGARACLSAAQARDWHAVEAELAQQWPSCKENSTRAREEALPAVRGAWDRGAARTTPHACVAKRSIEERPVLHRATPRRTLSMLPTTR